MEKFFTTLLNMNLTASIGVIIVIVMRFVLKKAPKRYICLLWLMVALRMIFPFSISSPLSIFNTLNVKTDNVGQVEYFKYGSEELKPVLVYNAIEESEKTLSLSPLSAFWLAGVIAMMCYGIGSYLFLKNQVKASVRRKDGVYLCDDIYSPFILGIFKPKIYLPSGLSSEDEHNVLMHERAHLERFDHLFKPLAYLLLCIYWFNPLLWLAYILLCRDIESACDERVIEKLNRDGIVSYSESLLSLSVSRRMISVCPVAFGETNAKERVKNVLNYKKPAFWLLVVCVVICTVAGVSFMTNASASEEYMEHVFKEAGEHEVIEVRYYPQSSKQESAVSGDIESTAFRDYLAERNWKKTDISTKDLAASGSIEFTLADNCHLTIYENSNLVKLEHQGEVSCYRAKAKDYDEAIAMYSECLSHGYDFCRTVMINDELYYDTGCTNEISGRCGTMDGEINMVCNSFKTPSANGQSNFGRGYGYQIGMSEGTVELSIDGKWCIFARYDVKDSIHQEDYIAHENVVCGNITKVDSDSICVHDGEHTYVISKNWIKGTVPTLNDEVEFSYTAYGALEHHDHDIDVSQLNSFTVNKHHESHISTETNHEDVEHQNVEYEHHEETETVEHVNESNEHHESKESHHDGHH